jgi:hypothetical protein
MKMSNIDLIFFVAVAVIGMIVLALVGIHG